MTVSSLHRRRGGVRLIVVATTLALAALGGIPGHAAAARQAAMRPSAARPAASSAPLSQAKASAEAAASGQAVVASALTTPTSQTTANPDGSFTLSQSLAPVRAWRNGAWTGLDATLHTNPDSTLSPAVTTSGLILSGGGTSPLAVMTSAGRSLSLSWPGTLPVPALSGATATYPNVLPSVDLVVTADAQGGFSDVLVVKSAAAAVNPALASLKLTAAAPGLAISSDAAGDLAASPGPSTEPVFTAVAPQMWDSATPAVAAASTGPSPSGAPASSSVTGPGAGAHIATIGAAFSGATITLTPPASLLAGPSTVYPVYIDPTWTPNYAGGTLQEWAQVDSAWPSQTYWRESSNLQTGLCDWEPTCNGGFVARSFVQMSIASQLTGATIISSQLNFTEEVAPSCTATPVELWTTGPIRSSTDWSNQPSWSTNLGSKTVAYGYSGCPAHGVGWDITSAVAHAVASGYTNQTFGLRAASETTDTQWKQFANGGSSTITMSTEYNHTPNKPASPATSPGGTCQTGPPSGDVIGNNDVTFSAAASDPDGGQVQTRFVIKNYGGATVYDSNTAGAGGSDVSPVTTSGHTASITLTRAAIQAWNTGGTTTAYPYSWYAQTTDGRDTGPAAATCNFTYNPVAPAAPAVSWTGTPALGQSITATFATPGCSPTGSPCPVSYAYQLGAGTPVTVTPDASGNWTGPVPIRRYGPTTFRVYGTAPGGNPSPATTPTFDAAMPAAPYADGDLNGDSHPDLLTVGTSAAPGLWLSQGNGAGGLGPATDIGGLGTGLSTAGGPGDWKGAIVLRGDFTGDHVQDVLAYYPPPAGAPTQGGAALIIGGTGDGSTLQPFSGNATALFAGALANTDTGNNPSVLVAAGNASLIGTGSADLIGITGTGANSELDLFTSGLCQGCASPLNYQYNQMLSLTSPDGANWDTYALASAQPGGKAVLFALDTTSGALYESTNPAQSASSLIGTTGTWTQITTVPWTSSAIPHLVSGDVNSAGQAELWAASGTTATAYALTSPAVLSLEATDTLTKPAYDWPLADGGTATTADDTITGNNATLTGGATWTGDGALGTVVNLDGTTGYLTPAANPATTTTPTLSAWFKTFTADGVLASLQASPLSSGSTIPGGYDPVLYVGTDGKLHGEWATGTATPLSSTAAVDDGIWHHAVLTGNATTQALYLDGQLQASATGTISLAAEPDLNFGAGYIGGGWPAEPHHNQSGNTGYLDYFNGQIAALDYAHTYAPPALPADAPGQISGYAGKCVDDTGGSTTNGNPIQIYACNGLATQGWALATDGTLRMSGKCADITSAGTANGSKIQLWTCLGGTNQQWRAAANGTLINPASGRCLDDTGSSTTNGTQLQIWDCSGGANQAWTVPAPPASYWPLTDGGASPAAADTTGGQTATLAGNTTWATDPTRRTVASFNGTTSYAATGGPILSTTSSYTVSAWVNLASTPTRNATIIAQDGNQNSGFYLQYNYTHNSTPEWAFSFTSADTANSTLTGVTATGAAASTWTHLTGVYNASADTAQLYINGTLAGAASVTPWNASGAFTIGRALYNGSSTDFFPGKISDVQAFTTALTAAQVTALYNEP